MTTHEFTKALKGGTGLVGTLIVSPSPRWPGVVRGCGLDFVFIDTEHVAIGRETLSWMCQAYGAMGLPPVVRIPSPDPYAACMVLDGGAAGVIAPYVESVEQVKELVGAVKLRPIKGAKLNQRLVGEKFEPALEKYAAERNVSSLIVNIESVPAMEALGDIVRVEGLDGVLIGPHDLSCSLGVPEEWEHPKFLAACEEIFRTTRAAGVGAGIHFWGTVEQSVAFARMGANLIIHSADISLMQKHLTAEVKAVREGAGMGRQAGKRAGEVVI